MPERSPEPLQPESVPIDETALREALRSLLGSAAARVHEGGAGGGTNGHGRSEAADTTDANAEAARVEHLAEAGLPSPMPSTGTERTGAGDFEPADVELLGDIAAAECAVTSGAAAPPSASVLAAARAAFAGDAATINAAVPAVASDAVLVKASSVNGSTGGPHLRVLHGRRPRPVAASLKAVAAVLIVGVGLAWLVSPRAAEAEPRLALSGIDRYALGTGGSRIEVAGRRDARPGERFTAAEHELLALHLAAEDGSEGGRLVLRSGGRVDVATAKDFRREAGNETDALLRLEGGEALLACEDTTLPAPVRLLLAPRGNLLGLLVLERGAAHVALTPTEERPAVALAEGARARFHRIGAAPVELRGPQHVLLAKDGPVTLGEPARALFRDLEMLGGPLKIERVETFVGARLWRVVSGRSERGGEGLTLLPAPYMGRAGSFGSFVEPDVVLGWTPDVESRRARVLRLMLRGPAGLIVSDGFMPAEWGTNSGTGLGEASAGSEPGVVTLELALPESWADKLQDGELRLALTWPRFDPTRRTRVQFDGAFLAKSASSSDSPSAAPAAERPSHEGGR